MTKSALKLFLISIAACIAFCSSIAAAAGTERFTAKDIFDYEFVSDPQISPDGNKIVYVRNFADIMTDKRCSNLWIINYDGTGHRPLTSGNYNDSSPRWSPDGKQLIYISNRGEKPQIYKRWMDSGQTVVLTNLQFPPAGITWAPDGKQIAFTALVPFAPHTIAELPAPPPGAEWAEPAQVIDRMVYRFDKIGYIKGVSHLYVLPSEGGTPRQLSSGDFDHRAPLVWTPGCESILLSANRKEKGEFEPGDTEIYEFSVKDGAVKALTERRGPDNEPAISPDGRSIAYTGYDDRFQGYQVTKLYIMGRDGKNSRVVTENLDRSVGMVCWAADGKGLYFQYSDKGNTKLAFSSLDGQVKILTGDIGSGVSAYGGGDYTISSNGRFAIAYSRPDHPSDIAVGSVTNSKVHIITSVNTDILANKKLGDVEETWYESSHDGRKIQGWIIKPPDFEPSKKYPLIIEIHGGPWADYGDRFDIEKQIMASRDYVVLYTNPRGSTSYGEEFGNLIHHAYPGDDFFDLNSGVDAVITKGYIDESNLFVTGGSGGGVLTSWMIGRTTRFRAAVTVYPVINWYSFVLTTDIPIWGVKYVLPGYPWDNVEHYEKRNLLSVVKNVTTPTMVLCGEEDWRCPISESEQYYRALKLLGVEAVLVRVPGEPHGIRVRPSHHISKIQHILGWFDKHRTR
ncbi:MAG: S9 family peptidase [Candidatus Aminicenantes bacterium]|nr:S9 family peptidase [Candidatus Aminicenantes bacterium]